MCFRLVRYGVIVLSCWLLVFVGMVEAEDYQGRIAKMLNLGTPITVDRYFNGSEEVDIWMESDESGSGAIKNWGIFYYSGGKYTDAWFYTGPLTNQFKRFFLSFHNLTKSAQKEIALVGERLAGDGSAQVFIFSLEKKKIQLLQQSSNEIRGTATPTRPDLAAKQGFYSDLNKDHIEEFLVYREVKGSLASSVYWLDIYSWHDKGFTLVNKTYPNSYRTILQSLEKAAATEEQLPDGQHRTFYEQIARVYDYMNKPTNAASARERANLPAAQMGQKMLSVLHAKGYRAYQMIQQDLDGEMPLDAVIRAKSEGKIDQFWLICGNYEKIYEPILIPVPQELFTPGADLTMAVKENQIWISRNPTVSKVGVAYLYTYHHPGVLSFSGYEELRLQKNGQVMRTITGQVFKGNDTTAKDKTIIQTAFLKANPCLLPPVIDGLCSENDWLNTQGVEIGTHEQVVGVHKEQWYGAEDLAFSVKALYRGNSLYLFLKVWDNNKVITDYYSFDVNKPSDHIEIYLAEKEKVSRYGIFILPAETLLVEWVGKEVRKTVLPVRAQWLPSAEGYWVEVELSGLNLSAETYPVTVVVADVDDQVNPVYKATMSTSLSEVQNRQTMSMIKLR